jgi:aerobic-type carbon monoxide dehydrogenase small subunit (CoxS/CutS family)
MIDDQPTRSCVARLGAVSGKNITTIEGIATGEKLHPVQEAFIEAEAFQCGYCTPGMVMATIGLLKTNPSPTEADIARVMDRNVCRCGTYLRIVKAIQMAAEHVNGNRGGGTRHREGASVASPEASGDQRVGVGPHTNSIEDSHGL